MSSNLIPIELTKVNPITEREESQPDEDEDDKVVSIAKSINNEFIMEESKSNEDGLQWDSKSDEHLSNNHDESKSYPYQAKSNNIDKSKNTENIHEM